MRVLWICNVPIPEAKEVMGDDTEVRVSWLVGISKALKDSVDLYIAYTSVGFARGKATVSILYLFREKKKTQISLTRHLRNSLCRSMRW